MTLYDELTAIYPELKTTALADNGIELRNDGDGGNDYIAKWEYPQPIPAGLKLGK